MFISFYFVVFRGCFPPFKRASFSFFLSFLSSFNWGFKSSDFGKQTFIWEVYFCHTFPCVLSRVAASERPPQERGWGFSVFLLLSSSIKPFCFSFPFSVRGKRNLTFVQQRSLLWLFEFEELGDGGNMDTCCSSKIKKMNNDGLELS